MMTSLVRERERNILSNNIVIAELILYGVSGRGINYEFATLVHLYSDKIDTVWREWQRNKL
jgi:hypothetical protein